MALLINFPSGDELAKAESIKSKMVKNLEMARERVTDLCEYKTPRLVVCSSSPHVIVDCTGMRNSFSVQ